MCVYFNSKVKVVKIMARKRTKIASGHHGVARTVNSKKSSRKKEVM